MADLACAIANGAEAISDLPMMGDQEDLFDLVASVPTAVCTDKPSSPLTAISSFHMSS